MTTIRRLVSENLSKRRARHIDKKADDETVSDVWIEDCSIASVVAHLTAHSLGLGSCWIQIRNRLHSGEQTAEQYIQALLGMPAHVRVEAIISIGDPAEAKSSVPKDKLDYGKIRHNRY